MCLVLSDRCEVVVEGCLWKQAEDGGAGVEAMVEDRDIEVQQGGDLQGGTMRRNMEGQGSNLW